MNDGRPPLPFIGALLYSVPFQEKVNFARHLSIGIKSGMPLMENLRLIRGQTRSKRFQRILDRIMKDVENGQFLAQSMKRFRATFGDFFINLVKVGESSGNLSSSLLYLAEELKKQREVSQRVRSALIYPFIILIATLGITVFLTFFIFPKILPIFSSLRVELPFTTRLVIMTLSFIKEYGIWVLGGLVAFIMMIRVLLFIPLTHLFFDRLILSVPVVSKTTMSLTLANFTRSLSVLLKSGMNIVDALATAKGTFHNLYYRREVERIVESVRRGESIARYIENHPRIFPPMVAGMIRVGESTGNLQENLLYLAEFYENEVDELTKNLTAILEPVLLLFMGLLVGFIALSIITPIYKITEGLQVH